jgi:mitogen-activated protein kinase 1/3
MESKQQQQTNSKLQKILIEFDFLTNNGYDILEPIGEGSYGCVVKAFYKKKKIYCAVKKTRIREDDLGYSLKIIREIALLTYMRHPNIVELKQIEVEIDVKNGFTNVYLIFDLYSSDLWKLVKGSYNLSNSELKLILFQILHGLKYIHSKNVLHRDLKTGNILLNRENMHIKICDFGLARTVEYETINITDVNSNLNKNNNVQIESSETSDNVNSKKSIKNLDFLNKLKNKTQIKQPNHTQDLTRHVATRWYRAPELILWQEQYGEAVDIWSFGCIFAELVILNHKIGNRIVLFPGATCVTLSPVNYEKMMDKQKKFGDERKDQIEIILDVIGTPSDEDIEFLSNPDAISFIKRFKKKERKDFKKMFPLLEPSGLDLLDKILQFNPFKRPTADECLNHSYFNDLKMGKLDISDIEKYIQALNYIYSKDNEPLNFKWENDKELDFNKLSLYFIELVKHYNMKNDW